MATKAPTSDVGASTALPSSITLAASYSGFWDDGSHYAYDACAVISDPAAIAYFMGRSDAAFSPAAE